MALPLDFASITIVLKEVFPAQCGGRVAAGRGDVGDCRAEKCFLFQTSMTLCSLVPCQGPLGPG